MKRAARPFLIIGIVWMILLCGCATLTLFRPGILTRWNQAPLPPEPLGRLALGEAGEVLAYTSNGTLYEFHYGIFRSPSAWTKLTRPSGSPAIGMDCSPESGSYLVLPPPGKTVSRVRENCGYMESAYHLEVALLENGEVWSWEHEVYAYATLFLLFFLFLAFMMGVPFFVMGLGLKIVRKIGNMPE